MAKLAEEGNADMMKTGELLLEVQDVHKTFGDRQVLKGIDLQVERGEVIVILGPSGCGKAPYCAVSTVLSRCRADIFYTAARIWPEGMSIGASCASISGWYSRIMSCFRI